MPDQKLSYFFPVFFALYEFVEFGVAYVDIDHLDQAVVGVSLPVLEDISLTVCDDSVFIALDGNRHRLLPKRDACLMKVSMAIVRHDVVLLTHVDVCPGDVDLLGVEHFEVLSSDNPCFFVKFLYVLGNDGAPNV